ncbi:hypothetical protein JCM6882_006543 [Rhodosporidiobolus microsporus]
MPPSPPSPTHKRTHSLPSTAVLTRRRRLVALFSLFLFTVVSLTVLPPIRTHAIDAAHRLKEALSTTGREWVSWDDAEKGRRKASREVEELRAYRWAAEVDGSLLKVVEQLDEHDRQTRDWLRLTRPYAFRGSPIGYSSPRARPVYSVSEGIPASAHKTLPGTNEGTGQFRGGSLKKYAALLEEWRTGRHVGPVPSGKWQERYTKLHSEILAGDREPRLIEYWCPEESECGGLADRMLGMTSTFLFALLSDRAFVATWDHPVPLSLLFGSPFVDWSEPVYAALPLVSPKEGGPPQHPLHGNETLLNEKETIVAHNGGLDTDKAEELVRRLMRERAGDLAGKEWIRLDRPNRGIALSSFSHRALLPRLASLGLTPSTIYAQLVHFLFRPKLEVLLFINEYTSLFALPSVFAVGIQVRTGDAFMTYRRHRHFFDCANEVYETYASPSLRPLYFLITDSASLRRSALSALPDRVVVSGLVQHHNELRDAGGKAWTGGDGRGDEEKEGSVQRMKEELEGLQNTVAESWIFEQVDFALLSAYSGFGKIPTFMHGNPRRAIQVPRVIVDPNPDNAGGFIRPEMPSCRLESSLASFANLASGW